MKIAQDLSAHDTLIFLSHDRLNISLAEAVTILVYISVSKKYQIMVVLAHEIPRSREITPHDVDRPRRLAVPCDGLLAWRNRHGGIMRIRRAIIIPAILALGAAGSILSATGMSAEAGSAPSVHVPTSVASGSPHILYHT